MATLSQVGCCQDQQARVGIDVPGLASSLGSVVCALHLGIDVHRRHIIQQADASRDGSACLTEGALYLGGVDFLSEVLCHQVKQGRAQLDDLLVGEALALELSIETLGDRLVAVQVQLF